MFSRGHCLLRYSKFISHATTPSPLTCIQEPMVTLSPVPPPPPSPSSTLSWLQFVTNTSNYPESAYRSLPCAGWTDTEPDTACHEKPTVRHPFHDGFTPLWWPRICCLLAAVTSHLVYLPLVSSALVPFFHYHLILPKMRSSMQYG